MSSGGTSSRRVANKVHPLTAGLLWIAISGLAPAPQAGAEIPEPVTSVEGITEYRLDNGLQVLLFPDQSKPTVTINVTYLVGSRHEGRGEAGMAHLLEHMVFKGTPTYENIWGELEDHGAEFNGTTWVDRTNYYETLPASDENLEFALKMEADRMVNSLIAAEELAKEMTVVRNEFEMSENYPMYVLSTRMMGAAYEWHNYGKSTIGNRSDIERVPVENLRRFYERYYQPDNAMLVVAGKFEPTRALELINTYFAPIPRPERVLDQTYTEEPTQDGARLVTLERVGDVAVAGVVYHVPAGSHADFAAVQVLEEVLTAEPSGRLYKALVEPGLATGVGGSAYAWAEPGVMMALAEVRADQDVRNVLDVMTEVVESIATADITDEEVERVKTRIQKNIKLAMNDSGRIGVQLSEWAALGDWRMFFLHRDRIEAVTTEDVQRVAGAYLMASNRTAGLYIPTPDPVRAKIPETPVVAELVEGYEGREAVAMGEEFEATPENIESRTSRETLREGLRAAFLVKETRADAVRASFRFRYGTEEALTGHTTALSMIPSMMMRGTTGKSFEELRDAIDQLESRIGVSSGGPGLITASIESDRANVLAAIELLAEIVKTPSFDAEQFAIEKKERLAGLEESLSDPEELAFTTLRRATIPWPEENIRYVPTIQERIDRTNAVELDQVKGLYEAQVGAGHLDVAFVGDFDEAEVKASLLEHFGEWDSPAPYERIATIYKPLVEIDETIMTPDKQSAAFATATTFEMDDRDPDYAILDFATYILGESSKSRLLTRLRHEGGLSYWVGAWLRANSLDKRASLTSFGICAPQNAGEAQSAQAEEIQKWISEGITDEEIEEGQTSYALKLENDLAKDQFVVGRLASDLELDRTFTFLGDLVQQVREASKEDIQRVLSERFANAKFARVKAGDFAAEAAADAALND